MPLKYGTCVQPHCIRKVRPVLNSRVAAECLGHQALHSKAQRAPSAAQQAEAVVLPHPTGQVTTAVLSISMDKL